MIINCSLPVLNSLRIKYVSKYKAEQLGELDDLLIVIDTDLKCIMSVNELNDQIGKAIISYLPEEFQIVDDKLIVDKTVLPYQFGNMIFCEEQEDQESTYIHKVLQLNDINKNTLNFIYLYNLYFEAKMFGTIILEVK